jgi:hypothetical protein
MSPEGLRLALRDDCFKLPAAPQWIRQSCHAIDEWRLGGERNKGDFDDDKIFGRRDDARGNDERRRPCRWMAHAEKNHQRPGRGQRKRCGKNSRNMNAGAQREMRSRRVAQRQPRAGATWVRMASMTWTL